MDIERISTFKLNCMVSGPHLPATVGLTEASRWLTDWYKGYLLWGFIPCWVGNWLLFFAFGPGFLRQIQVHKKPKQKSSLPHQDMFVVSTLVAKHQFLRVVKWTSIISSVGFMLELVRGLGPLVISHLARANCFSTAFLTSFGGYVGQLRALLAAFGVILGLCCCFWGMYFVGRREHLVCAPQPLPGQMVSILDLSDFWNV